MLKGGLTSKYNEYTPEERAKMGRYGAKNGPAKAARHFSQHLDGKLPQGSEALCPSGCIFFLVEGPNGQI